VNPQTVLQERYPAANLAVYFAFIAGCRQFEPEPQKGKTHEHHICPKKQFPEYRYEPENLITLYTPLHAHAHRLLGYCVPALSRANAAWIACASEGGRKSKENRTGIFATGMQAKGGRKGGRTQGRKHKENRTGIFATGMQAKGGRKGGIKGGRIANHLRWHVKRGIVNLDCSLCRRVSQQAV
jgi:hypothetical protein